MSFTKQLTRLQQLDRLIRMRCTGNAAELAEKLQVSQSSLFLLLQTAKELGAEIHFNHYRCTYEYEKTMRFVCGFEVIDREKLHQARGGMSCGELRHPRGKRKSFFLFRISKNYTTPKF
ncbi:hypothetical protein [Marinilabilia salmonicolor]|uniref:hypothetical protein n=1 Tax=Marinilabilia salmonicolor TaxID=989 RepID=UPI00029A54AF|nr:hypothetical protein [Marinilabilia salmonicolor]